MNSHVPNIKRWLTEHAGLDPDLLARDWFDRLIERRLTVRGTDTEDEYCRLLARDEEEKQKLVREVCVNETWFFRYPTSFAWLVNHLRALRQRSPAIHELRMLSVACASGQEPYSMAMAAAQAGWPLEHLTLDAIDCNVQAIEDARRALYTRRSLRDDAPDWARLWIKPDGGGWRVEPSIVASVRFLREDALTASSALFRGPYHVVFCRNLMIYLSGSARQQLVNRLINWLVADGVLFTGHAERLESLHDHFEFVADRHTFALRIRSSSTPHDGQSGNCSQGRNLASTSALPGNGPESPGTNQQQVLAELEPSAKDETRRLADARELADLGKLDEARGLVMEISRKVHHDGE